MLDKDKHITKMKSLAEIINEARKNYYSYTEEESKLTDAQYDKYMAELIKLETTTGIHIEESPSDKVGFEEFDGKIKHYKPILSLKDTKSIDELLYFLGEREGILSWKLDGLSIILHYKKGKLVLALSRGDGQYGRDITKNVLRMPNIPLTLPFKYDMIIRGEGCLSLKDFDQIKNTKEGERFSNPRNLAAGIINTVRTSNILLKHMYFIAHSLIFINGEAKNFHARSQQLDHLEHIGFKVVPYVKVLNFELKKEIESFTSQITDFPFPVDGLVLTLNNIKYGDGLGSTAKFPRHSMAFKWPDEYKLTTVIGMKWSVSRTGLITPVVLLKPIEMDGTMVKQANLHNLKFFEGLDIGVGDTLKIYKANKITPEVDDNLTRSKKEKYPKRCPVCNAKTEVFDNEKTRKLYCSSCGK